MDFDRKYKENLASQPMLLPENYLKSYMGDGGFSLEACSSKAFFQDFHHLDHQFPTNASSKTLQFGVQTACLDPFDSFTYGSGMNLDVYELKPYAENVGVMENFQSNNGGGYLLHHHQRAAAADMMGLDRGRVAFNSQEIKPVNFVIPDEVCIAAENRLYKKISMSTAKNGASPAAKKTYKGRKKTHVVKGQWTIEEDRLLIQLVEQYGVRKWSLIAQMLNGRIGKQCRERWHNHLRPNIKKDIWSEEEDKILIQAHAEIGNKWAEIAKRLPGRTENSIKNHWNATKRRQLSRRKCRSKYPRQSTILQNYIKSLNLDSRTVDYQKNPTANNPVAANNTLLRPPMNRPEISDFCPGDGVVPNFDYEEVPDFSFDANIFQENCSIDSLLNEMSSAPTGDEKGIEMENMPLDMASLLQCEVKKEMDLVEIISQVKL
ncbi:hypothetical protein PVL29_022634 [Vitis rotundifolia]|uniref:Transcription factor MYB98 n=1 Tax=Vitis rotundifolia TaxID=103349 RepID=A0AA38YWD9_VITRO|nr:hypothetical protein PVL29_022634 [Vitis rotundifolia]